MSREALIVGVDVATQAVRTVCCDPDGTVLATGAADLPAPKRPAAGRAEQDARSWWPATRAALREMTSSLDRRSRRISALAIAATSGTLVLVDKHGDPVGPGVMYDDRRGEREAERAQAAAEERWRRLGLRISPTFSLPKLAVLVREDRARDAAYVCHTPDLLTWRLVGARTPTDWSHALKTGYDALVGGWAEEAFEALEIDLDLLPEVLPPTTRVGAVSREAAAETGLPEGCEVRLGMTDSCAGQVACGTSEPGQFVSVLGTTLVLKGVTEELVRDPSGAVYSHRHPDGYWLPGGASSTGGEALLDYPRERLDDLNRGAEENGPASFLCYPLRREGERFPFVESEASGFSDGEPRDEIDGYRAALEGVAFCERLGYDHLARLGAVPEPPIATAGGGNKSRIWLRIRATVLGWPLQLAEQATTSFGASVLAAAGGVHPNLATAAERMVRVTETIEPVEQEREPLAERYSELVAALAKRGWIDSQLRTAAGG
ncbi:MAG: hypothetical protein JOY58_13525 [Solirubrobacterales bacterium]|nr:hypothetical protein [Solirubrobacterales bacterium]